MKIVQINTVYQRGSVGRIAHDLNKNILETGWEGKVVYGRGDKSSDPHTFYMGNKVDFISHVLTNFFCGRSGFASGKNTKKLITWLEAEKPDCIHLHNIHGFYLHVEELFAYLKKSEVPVVWTLHDCWAFTGHCAFFDYVNCKKWEEGCHHCSQYKNAYPYALFKDNSEENYRRKMEAFTGLKNLVIVTPSNWLKELVERSFLKEYPIRVIPNGINEKIFEPKRLEERSLEQVTVLGVANVWEKRKGLEYFEVLLEQLPQEYRIVLIGLSKKQKRKLEGKFGPERLTPITRTDSQEELAEYYNLADVFVNPTLEDNFPTTNLEALACGTPVITFKTGGSTEALNPMTGMIVPKKDVVKLQEAIEEMIAWKRSRVGKPYSGYRFGTAVCRERAGFFSQEQVWEKYKNLYTELAKGNLLLGK